MTTEQFIEKVQKIHINEDGTPKYDYSKTEYKTSKEKVCIICPKHGEFWQCAAGHIQGKGCYKCGRESSKNKNTFTKEQFIEKAKQTHGDKYDYSLVEYINNSTKVKIICSEHGCFEQEANSHINGSGCPECFGNKKLNTEEFIRRAKIVHNNKYDYSKTEYKTSKEKVCIICPKHGVFWQSAKNHLKGNECPECSKISSSNCRRKTKEQFIEQCKEIHGDTYGYDKVEYKTDKDKVLITCKKHGDFLIAPSHFLRGEGCRQCGIDRRANKIRKNMKFYINIFNKVHDNKYDYSKSIYINHHENIEIICPIHGSFFQTVSNHAKGEACPKCGRNSAIESMKIDTEEFIRRARITHGDKYNYDKVVYKSSDTNVIISCPEHGDFKQQARNHIFGQGCKKCFYDKSNLEREILDFIKSIYSGNIKENALKVLEGRKEIDIYIPDLKLGFEVNGLIWHSEFYKPERLYHLNKTLEAKEKKVRLIHIFEDEWNYKKDIVKSIISNIFNNNERIYARKCILKELTTEETSNFLNENHLQGNVYGNVRIGLFYNDELVSLMLFGKNRKNLGKNPIDGEYEMLRFCNKLNINVIGGASKIFKYFINTYKPILITSYADRRWSEGNLYQKLGFTLKRTSSVNYFYVVNKKRENRFKYRKDILVKEGYDKNKSEHEIMIERNIPRIYDCGCLVYEYKLDN